MKNIRNRLREAEKDKLEEIQKKEKIDGVTNRLLEHAANKKKKQEESIQLAAERELKDCTFVPKVIRKTKYLKDKARIGRFGEKDMAFLQTSSTAILQNKAKMAQT